MMNLEYWNKHWSVDTERTKQMFQRKKIFDRIQKRLKKIRNLTKNV